MILDHVRFRPTFIKIPQATDLWCLAAVVEDDEGFSVHKLLVSEVRQVLALPEVLEKFGAAPFAATITELATLVAELQAIVDKRSSDDWSPVAELFHPDMNISDIQRAVAHLLKVNDLAARAFSTKPGAAVADIRDALLRSDAVLWEGRKTQLEKDEAAEQPTEDPTNWRAVAATRGLTAERLWQMLDDIDTLSDQIKPTSINAYVRFYQSVLDIAKKRHLHLKSDGHTLTWPDASDQVTRTVPVEVADERLERYQDLAEIIENCAQGYAYSPKFPRDHAAHAKLLRELFDRAHAALQPPVPMLLHCPMCNARHIDEGEFATKSHHTHACQNPKCGHVWRPAVVATVGVWTLPGFLNEPMAVGGEALVGRLVRSVANGFECKIKSYSVPENTYLLENQFGTRMLLRLHEFTVLE